MRSLLVLMALMMPSLLFANPECPAFAEGVQFYKAEKYAAAIASWEPCLQQGMRNADLFYNLGNAEFREGALGKAVWAYESALLLDPTNNDIIANLKYVQSQTVDKTDNAGGEDNPVLIQLWRIHHFLSVNQQLLVLAILAWVAGLLILFSIWSRSEKSKNVAYISLFVIGVFSAILGLDAAYKAWVLETEQIGIVLTKSADVMSGPGDTYQVLHELHEGTRVEVREIREGWANVRIGENVNGFVKDGQVGLVK